MQGSPLKKRAFLFVAEVLTVAIAGTASPN
jgi:hypothetical protein